jgi:hypothetical protein
LSCRTTYTTWQQNQAAALAAKNQLYAEAIARMPEVKKAYDQAKNKVHPVVGYF